MQAMLLCVVRIRVAEKMLALNPEHPAAREKQNVTYKGTPMRLSPDFSTETLQARREWQEIFKVLKAKKKINLEYSIQQEYNLK